MATYQEIRYQIVTLSAEEQLQLLEELATILRHRLSPNPEPVDITPVNNARADSHERWLGMSALEAARSIMGMVGDGPPDLSTNPKYMEGFGEV